MLKIWGRATSSNVQKVLWCCAELGIEFERVDVGGPFGGNRDPEYLAMNPNGLVPTVKDGDLVMWESNTICRYLAATRNGEHLYPRDPAARTHVERWMDWQLAVIGAPMGQLLFGLVRSTPETRDPARSRRRGAARRRLDHRRRRGQGPALSRRRPAEPRRDRARHADLPLVRLPDRAAGAAQSARLVRPDAPAPRLQGTYRDRNHLTDRASLPRRRLLFRRNDLPRLLQCGKDGSAGRRLNDVACEAWRSRGRFRGRLAGVGAVGRRMRLKVIEQRQDADESAGQGPGRGQGLYRGQGRYRGGAGRRRRSREDDCRRSRACSRRRPAWPSIPARRTQSRRSGRNGTSSLQAANTADARREALNAALKGGDKAAITAAFARWARTAAAAATRRSARKT